MTLADYDVATRGLLDTVGARLDVGEEELVAFAEAVGQCQVQVTDIAGGTAGFDEDIATYFALLEDDDADAALDSIGGDSMYAKTVGRACDRVEGAFLKYLDELPPAPLAPAGPRLRPSALATRTLALT